MPAGVRKNQGCFLRTGCLTLGGTAGILFGLILALAAVEFVLTALGAVLIIADPIQTADAAVVLSGGGLGRLEEASKLYGEKYINWVILTETGESSPEFGLYSEIDRIEAVRLGVPPRQIIITEQNVKDTSDEAKAVRDIMEARGFSSVLVITDPFHSLRTRLLFREIFKDSSVNFFIRPVRSHWYRSSTWWTSQAGWEATWNEYVRIFYYLAKKQL